MSPVRSLTLRLALLYAASTVLILLVVAFVLVRVIDSHFIEQDVEEMRGKLDLAARLIDSVPRDELPIRLDEALVGHHHLTLALFEAGRPIYRHGHATMASERYVGGTLSAWRQDGVPHRGLARELPQHGLTVAVAVNTTHHQEFLDNFKLALWGVLALAALVAAALGVLVARTGLAPLRQTAHLAGQITAEKLDRRLPAEHIPPELEELTRAFNGMLDRLEEAFARLSAFSADLAHEMRTPVNNLLMQTQVTLGQARTAEEYREVLLSNLEEYERLARMVADMLFLAKADNGLVVPTREPVDLSREVTDLFEFFDALAEDKGVRLTAAGAATVGGDRLMLRRALANLLSNAIRHASAGQAVEVSISTQAGTASVSIDNPCATPLPEPLDRLFERFYRPDPARHDSSEGAGLGLAIVRSIARAHGGTATAAAIQGGIRFTLNLPAEEA